MRKSEQTSFVKVYCYKVKDLFFCMNDVFADLINSFVYVSVNTGYC